MDLGRIKMPPSVEVKIPPDNDEPPPIVQPQLQPAAKSPLDDLSLGAFQSAISPDLSKSLAALNQAMAKNSEAAAALRKGGDEQERIGKEIEAVKPPAIPKLEDIPPPPKDAALPPEQAFGTVLGAFASLAGLFSRRPAIDAMKAMSGVLRGANQRNQQEREYQMKRYQAAVNALHDNNQKELDEFNAMAQNDKFTIAQKNAYAEAIAAKYQNQVAAAQLEAGGYGKVAELYQNQSKLMGQFLVAQNRLKAQLGMFGVIGGGDDPTLDTQATELLRGVPPNIAVPGYGTAGTEIRKAAQQRAAEMYIQQTPGATYADAGLFMADQMLNYHGAGVATGVVSRQLGQVRYSANEITNVLVPKLRALAQKLNLSKYPDIDSALLFAERHGGSADAQNWRNLIIETQQAYARVLSRGGVVSDANTKRAQEAIPENLGTEQASSTFDLVLDITGKSLLQAQLSVGQVTGAAPYTGAPGSAQPGQAQPTGLQNGQTGTSKSGKPMHVENGQWVYD